MLRFLADENIATDMVAWLRLQQCDVVSAADDHAQVADSVLLKSAEADRRLLITEDKDFGELVFRDRLNSHGVVLLRMGKLPIAKRIERLADTWSVVQSNPQGCFIVITEKKVRVRPLHPNAKGGTP
jgi:predicted nuclease of predicted toxin-antitoxin system